VTMPRGAEDFETFFRTRGPASLHAAYLSTGERHLAEDLVQEASARAIASGPGMVLRTVISTGPYRFTLLRPDRSASATVTDAFERCSPGGRHLVGYRPSEVGLLADAGHLDRPAAQQQGGRDQAGQ
jgi:hypothetical protein